VEECWDVVEVALETELCVFEVVEVLVLELEGGGEEEVVCGVVVGGLYWYVGEGGGGLVEVVVTLAGAGAPPILQSPDITPAPRPPAKNVKRPSVRSRPP